MSARDAPSGAGLLPERQTSTSNRPITATTTMSSTRGMTTGSPLGAATWLLVTGSLWRQGQQQFAGVPHRATESPDSASLANRMTFAIGTPERPCRTRSRSPAYGARAEKNVRYTRRGSPTGLAGYPDQAAWSGGPSRRTRIRPSSRALSASSATYSSSTTTV